MSRPHFRLVRARFVLPMLILATALALGACSKGNNGQTGATGGTSDNGTTASNSDSANMANNGTMNASNNGTNDNSNNGALTDANIAAIVTTANTIDIDNGKMAQGKTKNNSVKAFASQMIHDHGSSNDQAKDLASRLNLTPQDDATSNQLKSSGDATRDSLKQLDGMNFDRAYVHNEVAFHEAVLSMLDKTLIPGAQNAELKSLLRNTRPVVAAHLAHARVLDKTLSVSGATASRPTRNDRRSASVRSSTLMMCGVSVRMMSVC